MALKGTDIVKKLPEGGKKNCRECGFPTCFAFAMKLASGGVSLDKCPYLPEDLRAELEDALAPPIKPVTIGSGKNALTAHPPKSNGRQQEKKQRNARHQRCCSRQESHYQ